MMEKSGRFQQHERLARNSCDKLRRPPRIRQLHACRSCRDRPPVDSNIAEAGIEDVRLRSSRGAFACRIHVIQI